MSFRLIACLIALFFHQKSHSAPLEPQFNDSKLPLLQDADPKYGEWIVKKNGDIVNQRFTPNTLLPGYGNFETVLNHLIVFAAQKEKYQKIAQILNECAESEAIDSVVPGSRRESWEDPVPVTPSLGTPRLDPTASHSTDAIAKQRTYFAYSSLESHKRTPFVDLMRHAYNTGDFIPDFLPYLWGPCFQDNFLPELNRILIEEIVLNGYWGCQFDLDNKRDWDQYATLKPITTIIRGTMGQIESSACFFPLLRGISLRRDPAEHLSVFLKLDAQRIYNLILDKKLVYLAIETPLKPINITHISSLVDFFTVLGLFESLKEVRLFIDGLPAEPLENLKKLHGARGKLALTLGLSESISAGHREMLKEAFPDNMSLLN